MRIALVVLLVLLAGACSRDSESTPQSVTRKIPAEGIASLTIITKDAQVELSTGVAGKITVTSPQGVDAVDFVGDNTVRIRHGSGKLRLTAPAGLKVVVRVDSGGIDLAGSWGEISLTALKGNVHVATDALSGGRVTAQTGNVDFTTRSLPSESITLMAPAGSIELAIPSLFRGLVQIAAQTIETPVDARIEVRRAPGTATVLVGKGFTGEEHRKLPVHKRPGFWARARKKVSLSLAE